MAKTCICKVELQKDSIEILEVPTPGEMVCAASFRTKPQCTKYAACGRPYVSYKWTLTVVEGNKAAIKGGDNKAKVRVSFDGPSTITLTLDVQVECRLPTGPQHHKNYFATSICGDSVTASFSYAEEAPRRTRVAKAR